MIMSEVEVENIFDVLRTRITDTDTSLCIKREGI
jgi:hypothetical protein